MNSTVATDAPSEPRTIHSRRAVVGITASAAALLFLPAGAGWAAATPTEAQTSYVTPGHSIQAAINAARPGTRIIVGAGTYAERLSITKDRISLESTGAVLAPPPTTSSANSCSGLAGDGVEAAVCVAGQGLTRGVLGEHVPITAVERRIQSVRVAGFTIQTGGAGVVVAGADDASVDHNVIRGAAAFGVLSVGSRGSTVQANRVSGPAAGLGFIGMCSDDHRAGAMRFNAVSGYFVGICVQTSGTDVIANVVRGNGYGIFVDPGVAALVRANVVGGSVLDDGVDIVLEGAVDTVVRENVVRGTGKGTGILIEDAPSGGVATGNQVLHNLVSGHLIEVNDASSGDNLVRANS